MNEKGVCPACGQLVDCVSLVFAEECNIIVDDSLPHEAKRKLITRHPAVPGCAVSEVVSQQSGKVLETMCGGSLRPVVPILIQ